MKSVHKDQVTRTKHVDLLHLYLRVTIFSQERSLYYMKHVSFSKVKEKKYVED